MPVAIVRLVFIVLTFFHLLGPLLYAGLWLVIPRQPGTESILEKALQQALDWVAALGGRAGNPPEPPHTPTPSDPSP